MTSSTDDLSERENAIVRSAYRTMAKRGSHRLSLQDIAEDAGVSKALLFYHFGSKGTLLLFGMRWALQRTEERIRRGLKSSSDAQSLISSLIDAIFVDAVANREFYLVYVDLAEHVARDPSFGSLSAMSTKIINGLFEEVVEAGVEEGIFEVSSVNVAARNMRALIEGTFLQWIQTEDWRHNHDAWKTSCREAVLRLLGAAVETSDSGNEAGVIASNGVSPWLPK